MNRALAILLWLQGLAFVANATSAPVAEAVAAALPSAHLHNLFRTGTNVYSGGAPGSDAGFAEIARLGVTTLISVDGARPDIATARRHGLRYVHLPFGYDGVPAPRIAELVRAAQQSDGPVYVHCHHGLHRGPAAVAVLCQATAGWTTNQAVAWMRQAGTAADYPGLYRSAMNFRAPDAGELGRVVTLPEIAPTSPLIETMIAIDKGFERLKTGRKTQWAGAVAGKEPASEEMAKLLWEHLRELARTDDTVRRPASYRTSLHKAERAAGEFHRALKAGDDTTRDAAFRALSKSCAACHQEHRN